MPVLSIDGSSLSGYNQSTYIANFFASLVTGSTSFYGGTPDSAFGGVYYMNGDQELTTYTESDGAGGTQASDSVAILGGTEIAYDFIHNGAGFGHGITGAVDSLTFGTWVDGVTSGTQGTGSAGLITGLDEGLVIDGLDLSAAPGAGTSNPVHLLYNAVKLLNAAYINDLIATYDVEITGSAGADTLFGYGGTDVVIGLGGNDLISHSVGADIYLGGGGSDTLLGGGGADNLRGGAGADWLTGGSGRDLLTGGAGADTFVIKTVSGIDIVTDFTAGTDHIDLTALHLIGLSDLTVAQVGSHVDITVGSVTLQLLGLTAADVTADLFLF